VRDSTRPVKGVVHDLSPTGICVIASHAHARDQVVKLESALLLAVARVVSCRFHRGPTDRAFAIRMAFLTVEFATPNGTLISTRA
jgi:hypothetical protein